MYMTRRSAVSIPRLSLSLLNADFQDQSHDSCGVHDSTGVGTRGKFLNDSLIGFLDSLVLYATQSALGSSSAGPGAHESALCGWIGVIYSLSLSLSTLSLISLSLSAPCRPAPSLLAHSTSSPAPSQHRCLSAAAPRFLPSSPPQDARRLPPASTARHPLSLVQPQRQEANAHPERGRCRRCPPAISRSRDPARARDGGWFRRAAHHRSWQRAWPWRPAGSSRRLRRRILKRATSYLPSSGAVGARPRPMQPRRSTHSSGSGGLTRACPVARCTRGRGGEGNHVGCGDSPPTQGAGPAPRCVAFRSCCFAVWHSWRLALVGWGFLS